MSISAAELPDPVRGGIVKVARSRSRVKHRPERHALADGILQQDLNGRRADAARRHVDDPQQRHLVVRGWRAPANTPACRGPPCDRRTTCRRPARTAASRVAARSRRRAAARWCETGWRCRCGSHARTGRVVRCVISRTIAFGFSRSRRRNCKNARRLAARARLARSTLWCRVLLYAISRLAISRIGARRAIVVFEPNDLGLGPVVLETEDVRHLRPAPAVDRLIVVAHDAQVAVAGGQRLDDAVLAPLVSWYSSISRWSNRDASA